MKVSLLALLLGFLLDLAVGDPHWMWHPIRAIGGLIQWWENILRKIFPKTKAGEQAGGVILVVMVTGMTTAAAIGILAAVQWVGWWLRLVVETMMCYQILATRALKDESMKVYDALKTGDISAGRYAVSMIVGRDTDRLDAEGVTKAAVETVAENTSDGIIAPMLYMLLGGAALGFFYKAVNTMDSMVGYKNDKYLYFGRAAALFDDVLNYIPARVSAYMMILASYLCDLDGKRAYEIYKRDRYNHASPNSAHTEAVMAGALHVQLAGDAWYFGVLHEKKTIGDPDRAVVCEDIPLANRLLYMTAVISLLIFGSVKGLLLLLI